jgi:NAD(P)-dependent dehydrogenase (short-subunit alcohol dehydrogenase family)
MSLHGKVVIVTGANRGIGVHVANALATQGVTLVMACRDLAASEPVRDRIRTESRNEEIELLHLDLASLRSVRAFVDVFTAHFPKLDILINNAGAFSMARRETEDGFELSIGVNHLGPFLLTNLLLPSLRQASGARIVNVVSDAHSSGRLVLDDLHYRRRRYDGFPAYAASKLAAVLASQELAERLRGEGISVVAVHPGHVATGMWAFWPEGSLRQRLLSRFLRPLLISSEQGAEPVIHLAAIEDIGDLNGKYFYGMQMREPSPKCNDRALQVELWRVSEELTGLG